MTAMQYKILLPNNFDMNIIRQRVEKTELKQMDLKIYFLKHILLLKKII